jgi:SAM-dependent methyltransferase
MPVSPPGTTVHPGALTQLWRAEDRHFWFVGRREIIRDVLERTTPLDGQRILEVGCGSGNVLRYLAEHTGLRVTGGDRIFEALDYCRSRRSVPVVVLDVHRLPFAGCFEIVGLFDVLEHCEDDRQALRECHAVLVPRGYLALTVPARPELWSSYDEFSGHMRRYTREELTMKLTQEGFTVTRASYFMAFLAPAMYVSRHLDDRLGRRNAVAPDRHLQELRVVPGINEIALSLMRLEKIFLRRADLPCGASLLAIARKR